MAEKQETFRAYVQSLKGEMIHIDLSSDEVDYVGREQIMATLRKRGVIFPEDWSWQWTLATGLYKGNLPVRVRNMVWKTYGMNLTDKEVSDIGNIGRAHSLSNAVYHLDFDTLIDWTNGAFGDYVSCFWMSKNFVRSILRKKAITVRFWEKGYDQSYLLSIAGYSSRQETNNPLEYYRSQFSEYHRTRDEDMYGWGRAWIAPDVPNKGELIVFNSYPPALQSLTVARVLSKVLGNLNYRKIGLTNFGETTDYLYINGGVGYMISPSDESLASTDYYDLRWETPSR